jgi:hypothetical protein
VEPQRSPNLILKRGCPTGRSPVVDKLKLESQGTGCRGHNRQVRLVFLKTSFAPGFGDIGEKSPLIGRPAPLRFIRFFLNFPECVWAKGER